MRQRFGQSGKEAGSGCWAVVVAVLERAQGAKAHMSRSGAFGALAQEDLACACEEVDALKHSEVAACASACEVEAQSQHREEVSACALAQAAVGMKAPQTYEEA